MTGQKNEALKVITVDDSLIIAERLRDILGELENVNFIGNATTISSAIFLIEQHAPDVVILDINLEYDMTSNGINLLIFLKKKYSKMKIIMLTNLNDLQYRNKCLTLGAEYFLDKSNEFEKISEIIITFTQQTAR